MKKKQNWIWFIIKLFPIIIYIVYMIHRCCTEQQTGSILTLSDFMNLTNNLFNTFAGGVIFAPLQNALNIFFSGNISIYTGLLAILRYVAYLVIIEIVRIMYETIVFLPKFARSFFERKMKDD